jgi:hypothetical protein
VSARTIAGTIVVVALIVVSGLYLAGLLPVGSTTSSNGSTAGPGTFEAARSSGDRFAQGYDGGGWQLLAAGAFVSRGGASLPIIGPGITLGNCSIQAEPSLTSIQSPAFGGNYSSGASPLWELVYGGSKGGLVVGVVDGTPGAVATISGGFTCLELLGALSAIPSTVADSSDVGPTVAAAGGAAFLAQHPGANLSMSIWGGVSLFPISIPGGWRITYSLCSFTSMDPQPAPQFTANVSAAGVVTGTHEGVSNCSVPSAFGSLGGSGGLTLPSGPIPLRVPPAMRMVSRPALG